MAVRRQDPRVRTLGRGPGGSWPVQGFPALAAVLVAFVLLGTVGSLPRPLSVPGTALDRTSAPLAGWAGVAESPKLSVAASPASGVAPLAVTYWGNVTGTALTPHVNWTFGDGTVGSGSPIAHTFTSAGWYHANATATLSGSSWTQSAMVTVQVTGSGGNGPLQILLSPVPSQGTSPLPVSLTVSASGGTAPYSGTVCFGDGSCVQLPSGWDGGPLTLNHTYTATGTFTIVASADDAQGTIATSSAALAVNSPASLTAYGVESPSTGTAPVSVGFEAQASGGVPPYAVAWDFGDGSVASSAVGVPLSHTYASGGTFTPKLTVTDQAGHSAVYTLAPIQVQAPASSPVANSSSPWTGGWFGTHASEIGALGLIAVMVVFVLLVELRRRQDLTRQARQLVEAMENSQEEP